MKIIKVLVSIASGVSLVLVAGVTLHVISGGNDTIATVGAFACGAAAALCLRADV